jgi:hypothetical protein
MFKIITALFLLLIIICATVSPTKVYSKSSTTRTCGKEGHFSHSDGGGKFSWNAIRLSNRSGMSNPYLFIMFETYIDGTSDHFIVDIIDLPSMVSDFITVDGKLSVLNKNNVTVSVPDRESMIVIDRAKKTFFDMLPCYTGSYTGRGIQ